MDKELELQPASGSVIERKVFARLTHGRWWIALALLCLGLMLIGAFAYRAMRTSAQTPGSTTHAVGPR
jgi:hypothetical protein